MRTITTVCGCGCGVTFQQPDDPGRKRQYATDACKQRVYRARRGVTGHEARERRKAQERADQARQDREEARRREQDAARARARRARERARAQATGPAWTHPRVGDNDAQARARVRGAKLMERANHPGTNAHEASACAAKAETIRQRHGL
jgi:hypothetical protein